MNFSVDYLMGRAANVKRNIKTFLMDAGCGRWGG